MKCESTLLSSKGENRTCCTFFNQNSCYNYAEVNEYREQSTHGESLILSFKISLVCFDRSHHWILPDKTTIWNQQSKISACLQV